MRALLLLAAAPAALFAAPVLGQTTSPDMQGHDMHDMQGHDMSKMGDHDMSAMPGMDHSAHGTPAATDQPEPADAATTPAANPHAGHGQTAETAPGDTPGSAPPPPVATDYSADRIFPVARMNAARAGVVREMTFRGGALMVDQLEYRGRKGADGYAWKATGWYGGDINRVVLASEGEGEFGSPVERAEVRLMWRRAIDPYFNVELGVRHDFRPDPERTYAAVGIEGLAPYWFEVEGQLFVSNKGDVHARLGGSHDIRLSGPLVLQPEAEVNVAFQAVPELGIGSGVERLELGARLRYEIRPEFAPYVGVHWERKFGGTADFARTEGERASGVSGVVGLRAWF